MASRRGGETVIEVGGDRTIVSLFGRKFELIDISSTLSNRTSSFELNPHKIEYIDHSKGWEMLLQMGYPESVAQTLFPNRRAWAVEVVSLSTHSGTHVDAPYHYGPEMASGEKPLTIDKVPLSWCIGPGILFDMSHKTKREGITAKDLQSYLESIPCKLNPGTIALIRTDAYKYFCQQGYELLHPGLTKDATEFLVDSGVRMIGIDAWGLDRAFDVLMHDALEGRAQFWESHLLGLEKPYLQIEKLANLDKIPVPCNFWVVAFPFKIEGASAGWTRAVALVEVGGDGK